MPGMLPSHHRLTIEEFPRLAIWLVCIDTIITGSVVLREIRIRAHMGCLILCIGSLRSLLRCSVEFTVLIYFIVNTFHTPETKVMDILIQQIIDQLQCAGNILTAYSNCKSAS